MRKHKKYTDDFKRRVTEDYLAGMSREQVMKKYNINSHSTIVRWVKKWKEGKSFTDNRGKKSTGRPKKVRREDMTDNEYIEYLEMQLEIKKYLAFHENSKQK